MASEQKQADASWFEIPLFRGLTDQILTLGVPRKVLALNALFGFIFIMDFHFVWIIPVCIAIHFGSVYICKSDDQFFDCLQGYLGKKNYYST